MMEHAAIGVVCADPQTRFLERRKGGQDAYKKERPGRRVED